MRPVLIGATATADGRLALVFSVTPGHRVTIVAPDRGDAEATAEAIAEAVIPIITRTITPEGQTA